MPIKRSKQAKKLASGKRKITTTKQVVKRHPNQIAHQFGQPDGNPININAQFGKVGGNPRHNGAWSKDDNLRYKLQQIAKMSHEEIEEGLNNPKLGWGEYERQVGRALLDMASVVEPEKRFDILFDLTNQDSGNPRQQVEQTTYEAPIPLSPRQIITEPQTKLTRAIKKTAKKKKK